MPIEATHLGKKSEYSATYNPEVLVAVPRSINRIQYEIKEENLPFVGVDVWHAYEYSFLLKNGFPITGILKFIYSASSPYLVESKSLKLYLNSFNMSQFGDTKTEGIAITTKLISTDLSELLQTKVEVLFLSSKTEWQKNDFDKFPLLEDTIDPNQIRCTEYKETPSLLELDQSNQSFQFGTHLLRSNCKITFQPDWGSLFISIKGAQVPTKESFLKYVISLRNENHFHEEICEMVFKRIIDRFNPERLTVTCFYTRRGGIDINPTRSLIDSDLPKLLISKQSITKPMFRQ